ncbi:uncharacterized protein N7515_000877 [Penicillium bovifimosum]|uniref:WHIM1 domain-containing protein n=1 Tax=Penicillium bovifimosum TaxID=126998 RepID=A0A9W9HGF7_9EURO|nr:uncharacterized protein N7515_000877 [Penicillium bovifimosum]KAJ5146313.1 hypothetical protein N7515_000877 [Penicillium bovifimosum]
MPSDSELSSLSSAPPTDDEASKTIDQPTGIAKYFKKESETPPPKREPSPPHEETLADNPDIAFIVAFRARFHEVFPRSVPHYGPQDIEKGVEETPPGECVERVLCALLGLLLNRKKEVERNHYTRPLEEAIHTHQSQWPKEWEGKNPLHGGRSFATMTPVERIRLLRILIIWSLSSSEAVQAKIKESYKQARHDDDLNQPLSVQPWGRDSLKRRFWLIEGHDDTHFRLYRESNPALKHNTWRSVAGSIPELEAVAEKLETEKGTNAKRLSEKIRAAIPRFEASEEKRRRRDYRLARKAAFSRPDPGFSMYEGRTRGKKLKYTYSEDEDSDEEPATRRSTRNAASTEGATESRRPRFTASGRQIRSRAGGLYGEALLTGQRDVEVFDDEEEEEVTRPQRARTSIYPNGYSGYNPDDLDDSSEVHSVGDESGNEWQGVDDDLENDFEGDNEEKEASPDESTGNEEPESLVVQLRYGKGDAPTNSGDQVDKAPPQTPPAEADVEMKDAGETAAASSAQVPPTTFPQSNSDVQQAPTVTSSLVPPVPTQATPAVSVWSDSLPKPQVVIPQASLAAGQALSGDIFPKPQVVIPQASLATVQAPVNGNTEALQASQHVNPNGGSRS